MMKKAQIVELLKENEDKLKLIEMQRDNILSNIQLDHEERIEQLSQYDKLWESHKYAIQILKQILESKK